MTHNARFQVFSVKINPLCLSIAEKARLTMGEATNSRMCPTRARTVSCSLNVLETLLLGLVRNYIYMYIKC